ncbi:MAG: hypothetical protein HYR74_03350 [Candidatus Eisenbacteria bacterium]|nr:hypothetical protein [Candidatus Eisenbacteria bacterium]
MKPATIVCACVISVFAAASAQAGGLNLAWDGCLSEGGVSNKAFACNTNVGAEHIYGSFIPLNAWPDMMGADTYLYVQTQSTSLPDWWAFHNTGTCRQNAAAMTANFVSLPNVVCQDPWNGQAASGIGSYTTPSPDVIFGANTARFAMAEAVANVNAFPVTPGTEYLLFDVVINHTKTVGTGSCAGCTTPACLLFAKANIYALNGGPSGQIVEVLTAPAQSNCIDWRGGSGLCNAAVPAKNATWGAIKSLYR